MPGTDTRTTVPSLECCLGRATLARVLAVAGVGIARRPAAPHLGGVLLDGHDGDLALTTTDQGAYVSVRVPGGARRSGRLLIHHGEATKMLAAVTKGARKREADNLAAAVRRRGDTAVLEIGGFTVPITTYPANDFPAPPQSPPIIAEVDRERLTTSARRVLVATGTDKRFPMLTGIHLRSTSGALTLAGTDRYRLAVATLAANTTSSEHTALFPARLLSSTLRHCTAPRVRLGHGHTSSGNWVSLTCGDLTVVARPVTAEFPDYEQLFPNATITARTDRNALSQATTRATAILAAKKPTPRASHRLPTDGRVMVAVDPCGSISITPVLDQDTDAVTAPAYPAEVDGTHDIVRVLFRAQYLRDALTTLDGDTVTVDIASPTRPILLTGVDRCAYRHLLMPHRPPA
ncbi:DNA polymerase III subunit beta [Haloechinothrix salitolerans]|uniref:DNA polymerase III subunit beta n=1 Tax=Haloechinothrix salitolerans TaxID=926830 RepID=A0ABW2C8T4_9PSEU